MNLGEKIPCSCPLCGKLSWIFCEVSEWEAYTAGALAQNAFPNMSTTDRETVISGMCAECQSDFFTDEEEDEGEDW